MQAFGEFLGNLFLCFLVITFILFIIGKAYYEPTKEEQELARQAEVARVRRLKAHEDRQYRKAKANRRRAFINKWS